MDYIRQWQKKHPEKIKEYRKKYYTKHRIDILAKHRDYMLISGNAEKMREYGRLYRLRKSKKKRENHRCLACGVKIDSSVILRRRYCKPCAVVKYVLAHRKASKRFERSNREKAKRLQVQVRDGRVGME